MKNDIDYKQIKSFLIIGIFGAVVVFIGDIVMGWGLKDSTLKGVAGQLSPFLSVSDSRMFLSGITGLIGVPLGVLGHYGIYKTIKPYSKKYSRFYLLGILGFLAFGGAGVHLSSIEASFFYKYMVASGVDTALIDTEKFISGFLIPLYVLLVSCWILLVYSHLKAVYKGFTPFPRKAMITSMLVGTALISIVGLFGNKEFINALMVANFSFGNIWTLVGHLILIKKIQEPKMVKNPRRKMK